MIWVRAAMAGATIGLLIWAICEVAGWAIAALITWWEDR